MPSGGSTPITEEEAQDWWYNLLDANREPRKLYELLQKECKHFVQEWELLNVRTAMLDALSWGLQYDWTAFFVGGMRNEHKTASQAAFDACIEWDF